MLEYYGFAAAHFPALYDLEMHHWADAAALQPAAGAPPHLQTITYWAQTIGAARMGDVEAARAARRKFDDAEDAVRKSKYAYMLDGPDPDRGEVQAWLAFAEKKNDEAAEADARGRGPAGQSGQSGSRHSRARNVGRHAAGDEPAGAGAWSNMRSR